MRENEQKLNNGTNEIYKLVERYGNLAASEQNTKDKEALETIWESMADIRGEIARKVNLYHDAAIALANGLTSAKYATVNVAGSTAARLVNDRALDVYLQFKGTKDFDKECQSTLDNAISAATDYWYPEENNENV